AILPILILPTMVGALIEYSGFTESEAGWLATAGFVGSALGAIVIGLRIRHIDPRRLVIAGVLALALFDGLSALVSYIPIPLFVAFRFLSGLGGAAAYAAVVASIATMASPERGYGTFTVFQFGISAIGLYGLPYVLPLVGAAGMFVLMAIAAAATLLLTTAVVHREAAASDQAIELHMLLRPAAILAMLGIGLYETANFMQYTYAERIGLGFGLTNVQIGETLGLATLLGVPAGLAVVWLGDRFGQLMPLLAAIACSVGGHILLLNSSAPVMYVIASCMIGGGWAFGLAYFYSIEARLDPGGSVVVVGGFFTSCGSAIGPALAAMLVKPDVFDDVLLAAMGVFALVGVVVTLAVFCARKR
ncbi:MAG: MFS transporter, partial [Woeseiaceae bacterium]